MPHIFVSYARKDKKYVREIINELEKSSFEIWIDLDDLPKGEDWEQEIYHNIDEAEAFLFMLSPDSVASQMCKKEIAHAVVNGKRILPIVIRDTDEKLIPSEILKRNWIFCREGQDNLEASIQETRETIHTDYEWLKYHTRLQVKALEWERKEDASRLLRGKEMREAEDQLAKAGSEKEPQPTDIQRQYILASKRNEERQRRQVTIGLGSGLIIMAALAVFAWGQRNSAVASESTAVAEANAKATALAGEQVALEDAQTQRAAAVENLQAAQTQQAIAKQSEELAIQKEEEARTQFVMALSDKLSTLALTQVDSDYTKALLLGVESVRILEENSLDIENKSDILPTLLQKTQAGLEGSLSRPPNGIVRKVVFDRNGLLMASASESVDLWDVTRPDSSSLLMSWTGKSASDVVFSYDSNLLVAGYRDGSVGFFDTKNLAERGSFQVFQSNNPINTRVALKSDGTILAVAGDGVLTIWNVSDLASPYLLFESRVAHKGLEITELFFHSSFANYLISSGDDRFVRVWDLQYPGNPVLQSTIQRDYGTAGIAMSLSRDANFVLVGGNYYDFYDGAFRPILQFDYGDYFGEIILGATLNAGGNKLYGASGDGTITEWEIGNVYNIKLLRTFSGHTNRINSMAVHPNGQMIVSGGNDSKIFFWNLTDEPQLPVWSKRIPSNAGINDIAYSERYNYLAVGEADSAITVWDVANPASWLTRKSFGQYPVQLTFSPAQDRLAVLTTRLENPDASVSTLDMTNLTYSTRDWLFDLNSDGYFAFGENFVLAAEDKLDGLVSIYHWDVSNPFAPNKGQKKLDAIPCPSLDSAYASKADLAAVISCKLQIWDFGENKAPVLAQSNELGGINNPRSVAFHPNGEILAIGTGDERNSIQFWDIRVTDGIVDAEFINEIVDPHLRPVTSVTFSMDGNALATGSEDQTVALWDITDIKNPKHRFSLKGHSGPILNGGVFFNQDGKMLISGTKTEVILWNLDQEYWFEQSCKIAGRNFDREEWAEFVGNEPYHATCSEFPIPKE